MAEYKELLAERRDEKEDEKAGRLDAVIDIWEDQKEWWNTDFTSVKKPRDEKRVNNDESPPNGTEILWQQPPNGSLLQFKVTVTFSRITTEDLSNVRETYKSSQAIPAEAGDAT